MFPRIKSTTNKIPCELRFVLLNYTSTYNDGVMLVFILSLISLIRLAFLGIVMLSLGMGLDAPRGRINGHLYAINTKGLFDVKKDICGRSPPGRNTRCRC
jgi:hypothetical protein